MGSRCAPWTNEAATGVTWPHALRRSSATGVGSARRASSVRFLTGPGSLTAPAPIATTQVRACLSLASEPSAEAKPPIGSGRDSPFLRQHVQLGFDERPLVVGQVTVLQLLSEKPSAFGEPPFTVDHSALHGTRLCPGQARRSQHRADSAERAAAAQRRLLERDSIEGIPAPIRRRQIANLGLFSASLAVCPRRTAARVQALEICSDAPTAD